MGRWIGLALALILAAGCAQNADEQAFRKAAGGLPAARQAAMEAGLPIEPATYDPAKGASGQNAADDYRVALDAYKKLQRTRSTWGAVVERLARSKAQADDLAAYNAARPQLQPVLSGLLSGSKKPTMDQNIDYLSIGFTVESPLDGLFTMNRLLAAEATLAAKRGDWATMKANLSAQARIAAHENSEPRLPTLLKAMNATRSLARTAVACVQASQANPEAIKAIQSALVDRPNLDLKRSLHGECASNIGLLRSLGTETKGRKLDGTAIAEMLGTASSPKTEKMILIVDSMEPKLAQEALEARMLEEWARFFPQLKGTQPEMAAILRNTLANSQKSDDPTYALIRDAYSELPALAEGVALAEATLAAIDVGLAELNGHAANDLIRAYGFKVQKTSAGVTVLRSSLFRDGELQPLFVYRVESRQ